MPAIAKLPMAARGRQPSYSVNNLAGLSRKTLLIVACLVLRQCQLALAVKGLEEKNGLSETVELQVDDDDEGIADHTSIAAQSLQADRTQAAMPSGHLVRSETVELQVDDDEDTAALQADQAPVAAGSSSNKSMLEDADTMAGKSSSNGSEEDVLYSLAYRLKQQQLAMRAAHIDWDGLVSGQGGARYMRRAAAIPSAATLLQSESRRLDQSVLGTFNPMEQFDFADTNLWTTYPSLRKEIDLKENCILLIQYQTSSYVHYSHFISRLVIDGKSVPASHSAVGKTHIGSTFGFFLNSLKAGYHIVELQYRTHQGKDKNGSRVTNTFSEGGLEWQTVGLNLLAFPEGSVTAVWPHWKFRITGSNHWHPWQGSWVETNYTEETPVLAMYTANIRGSKGFLASKMFVDGLERKQTRSVAGRTFFAQNTGFFVDTVPEGLHTWTVKFRHDARHNFFRADSEWTNRGLTVLGMPDADTWTVHDDSPFTTEGGDDFFRALKGLDKKISLVADRYILASYSVAINATQANGEPSMLKGVLHINGVEMTQTRSTCGDVEFCQLTGMYMGVLQAGTHDLKVMYSTKQVLEMGTEYDDEYRNRAMSIIALSRTTSAISF